MNPLSEVAPRCSPATRLIDELNTAKALQTQRLACTETPDDLELHLFANELLVGLIALRESDIAAHVGAHAVLGMCLPLEEARLWQVDRERQLMDVDDSTST